MNNQSAMAVEKTIPDDGKLLIKEIFYSIQGEGPFSGRPATFVRLGGCNLACPWCVIGTTLIATPQGNRPIKDINVGDTVYGFDGEQIVAKTVINRMVNTVDSVLKVTFDKGTSLFITGNHPGWVIDKGWIEAKDWKVGDVLFHSTTSDWMKLNNPMKDSDVVEKMKQTSKENGSSDKHRQRMLDYWELPDSREKQSERMKLDNPMKSLDVRKKSWTNRKHRLTSIEVLVDDVIKELDLPIDFVGDGSFWVDGHCPDFKVDGLNKVIEVWDSTQSDFLQRDAAYVKDRKAYYEERGFSCMFLVFNPTEFREAGDPKGAGLENCRRWLSGKLNEFLHNGKTITKIELINKSTNKKAFVRLAGTAVNPITVYNLEVAECHSYFANSILLHNCDTDYSEGIDISVLSVVEEVKRVGKSSLVVITGGEPFRQALLVKLCEELLHNSFQVQIETNGTCCQKGFSYYKDQVSVVCSPKTSKIHKDLKECVTAVKLLVRKDGNQTLVCYHNSNEPLAVALDRWKKFKIYLQPLEDEHSQENIEAVIAACLDYDLPISLQQHKMLNLR